jgi:NAD(P)-dependent dehydrogenase (short-subunit alcohol dehydrogenase family)
MSPYTLPPQPVWFITGCSSGIGAALCTHLALKTSARVVATARNPASLSALPAGPNLLKLQLDVTQEPSITAALAAAVQHYGRIDVLVNNAGYGVMSDTETLDLDKARALMETNFWGPVLLSQKILPVFREQNAKTGGPVGGLVLQITSLGGRLAFQGNTAYHASKFALEGFTEGLAKEMAPEWNIHFLCVEPGGVKTQWVTTDTAAFDREARLDVYKDPGMPTSRLLAYKDSPEAMRHWAEAERVVEVLVGYVERGGEMGLRLPLGSDSWGMQRKAVEEEGKRLDALKELACSTSGMEQLASAGEVTK